jgi:uncharacterized membrane protein YkvA (DUF1232 family)
MGRLGLLLILWRRFRAEAAMVWRMLIDRRVPAVSKLIAVAALVYLASPVDFLSDFVPVLGWLDDGLVLAGLLWLAYRFLPPDLYEAIRWHTGAATAEAGPNSDVPGGQSHRGPGPSGGVIADLDKRPERYRVPARIDSPDPSHHAG